MLNRINKIQNVGIFKEYKLEPNKHGYINFSKLNLIYGRNGTGKSTVVDLLRSLSTGEDSLIYSRKSLKVRDEQEVLLTLNNDFYRFSKGWNKTYANIRIFDQKYINENIFLADTITIDNRRNQFKLIIGESNVKITIDLNKVNEEIRKIDKEIKIVESKLRQEIIGNRSITDFVEMETKSDLREIQLELEELMKSKENLEQINLIQNLRTLSKLELPNLNLVDLEKFLSTNSNLLISKAEQEIKNYCKNKQIDESWIKKGYDYINGNKCPFCNQDFYNSDMFTIFKNYFNSTLNEYSQKAVYYNEYIRTNYNNERLLEIKYLLEKNNSSYIEMTKYLLLPDNKVVNPDEIINKISKFMDNINSLNSKKNENLLDESFLEREFLVIKEEYIEIIELTKIYNITVDSINKGLNEYIGNISNSNMLSFENQIEYVKNLLSRNKGETDSIANKYLDLRKKKKYLIHKKEELKIELLKLDKLKIKNFDTNLNRLLEKFNLPFKIEYESPKYGSYGPEVEYYIVMDNSKVKARVSKNKEIKEPNIKNTISEGEKYLLALSCFIACLEVNAQINNSIIVFDDPTSYCDIKNKAIISEQILLLSMESNQIFIFTHDNEFSKIIWDQSNQDEMTGLYIESSGTSSQIITRDKYRQNKVL